MSDHHEVTMGDIDDHHEGPTTAEKGKMKIPETHDASMGEDEEESSDEETGAEDAVCPLVCPRFYFSLMKPY